MGATAKKIDMIFSFIYFAMKFRMWIFVREDK
jgi:hypothetical protein